MELDGKLFQIYYYSCVIDDRQYWAFINQEQNKTFEGNFKLRLNNLVSEDGRSETDWHINLSSGGGKDLKWLQVVEPFEKVFVTFSSSFIVK